MFLRSVVVLRILVVMMLVSILAGCQSKVEIWINPDGSGRVTVDGTAPLDGPVRDLEVKIADQPFDPASLIESMMTESVGVRQWSDVTYKCEGGQIKFRMTAYFDDVNAVHFSPTVAFWPTFEKKDGKLVSFRFDHDKGAAPTPVGSLATTQPVAKLTEEQAMARAAKLSKDLTTRDARRSPQRLVGLQQCRMEYIIHLPGKVVDLSNLEAGADGSVRLVFDGGRCVAARSQILGDEKLLARVLEAGENPESGTPGPVMEGMVLERAWNKPGGVGGRLVADEGHPVGKALFDYHAQVDQRKEDYVDLLIKAGLLPAIPAINKENALTMMKAGPGKIRSGSPEHVDFMAQGETATKFYRALQGRVIRATDQDGKLVVPGRAKHGPTIAYPIAGRTGELQTHFELSFFLPKGPTSYKLIQGVFPIVVADSFEEIDVGEMDFKTGGKGAALGIAFTEVKKIGFNRSPPGKNDGSMSKPSVTNIALSVDPSVGVSRFTFLDASGKTVFAWDVNPLQPDKTFHTGFGGGIFSIPDRVRLKVLVLKNPRMIQIPFEFVDVPVEDVKK